jgi:anaerobic magnesium-protoporphyrin IX monomethyl ester cyclase
MAAYPSISNFQISRLGKMILKIPGKIRYNLRWYRFPFEVKLLLKLFSYQGPEKEGFYSK